MDSVLKLKIILLPEWAISSLFFESRSSAERGLYGHSQLSKHIPNGRPELSLLLPLLGLAHHARMRRGGKVVHLVRRLLHHRGAGD